MSKKSIRDIDFWTEPALTKIRTLNAKQLRDIKAPLLVHASNSPLAVLLRYEQFIACKR
jgi:hypothetical protein